MPDPRIGNNNAYCQDNPTSWVDWSLARSEHDLTDFVAALCDLRKQSPALHRRRFFTEDDIEWLRPDGEPMSPSDWTASFARAVAAAFHGGAALLLVNGWWEPVSFRLPPRLRGARWWVGVDSANQHGPGGVGPVDEFVLGGRSLMRLERQG